MKSIRDEIALLREFMNASAFPGPTPGQMWDLKLSYSPASRMMLSPDNYGDELYGKKFKDKNAKKRDMLRKLALWLQSKEKS